MDNDRDRLLGEHSNIPGCCIEFFITKWIRNDHRGGEWYRYSRMVDKANSRTGRQYVPCPNCLESGRTNKLFVCEGKTYGKGQVKCSLHPHSMQKWADSKLGLK